MPAQARWDSAQYARFSEERSRPFFDLLAQVPEREIGRAADLGCGTGELTRALLKRWPAAEVWGVDSSPEMLAKAGSAPPAPRLHIVQADLREWRPPAPLDLILSNAALQWVPDHGSLLESLATLLAPAGILAVQVPSNRDEAAYRILEELLSEPPWTGKLPGDLPKPGIAPPTFYEERLARLGFQVRSWETIYRHRLAGTGEIVEWLKGTTMRPVLSALSERDAADFLAALAARVARAYEGGPGGVVFPFKRFFFVAS